MTDYRCPSTIPKDDLLSHQRIKSIWCKPGYTLESANLVGDAAEMEEFYIPNLKEVYKFTHLTADNFCVWADALTTRYGDIQELDFISMSREVLMRLSNHKHDLYMPLYIDICGLLDTLETLALAVAEKSFKHLINSESLRDPGIKIPKHVLNKAFRNKRIFTRRLLFTFDKRVNYLTKTVEWHKANSDILITAQEHLIIRRKKLHDAEKALSILQQQKVSFYTQQTLQRHHSHYQSSPQPQYPGSSKLYCEATDSMMHHDITPIVENPNESMLNLETEDEGEAHVMNEFVNISHVKLALPKPEAQKFKKHEAVECAPNVTTKVCFLPPSYDSDETKEYDSASDSTADCLSVRTSCSKEVTSAELTKTSTEPVHGVIQADENEKTAVEYDLTNNALETVTAEVSGPKFSNLYENINFCEESATDASGTNKDKRKEKIVYSEQELKERIRRYEECLHVAMIAYKKRLRKVISSRDSLQYVYDDLMADMRFEFLHRLRVSQENLRLLIESIFSEVDGRNKYITIINNIDIDLVADSLIKCGAQKYIFPKLKPFIDKQPRNAIMPHARIVDRNVPTSMKSLVAFDIGTSMAPSKSSGKLHVQQIPEDDEACSVNSDKSEEFVHFMLKETGVLSDIHVETVTDADLLKNSQKVCDVKVTKWCSVKDDVEERGVTKERVSLEVLQDVTERSKKRQYLKSKGKHAFRICPGFFQIKSKGIKIKVKCCTSDSKLCLGWFRPFKIFPKVWGFFFLDDAVFNT